MTRIFLASGASLALALIACMGCGDDSNEPADASVDGSEPTAESCGNGVDDDGDGDTDCTDLDCLVPELDRTAPIRTWDAMAWVVEPQVQIAGCTPPQSDEGATLPPDTFAAERVAAVHGRVLDEAGAPLAGATVSVLSQPTWGSTAAHADGSYDLLVDPRAHPVLVFEFPDRIPAQRSVELLDGEHRVLDDVVLLPFAEEATTVRLGGAASTVQVARGPVVNDADGERQATLLFPTGITARARMPGGAEVPLETLTVRATEYTVGESGPAAMPGELPPASAFTYAVELSADEANAMGAEGVELSEPVSLYVNNFLGMPIGTPVPLGFYDRVDGRWEAEPDGIVMAIVGVSGGLAQIDTDGDGAADDAARLASFGFTDDERAALATTYEPGAELWRSSIPHFSPWDCNWPFGFPLDAILPALLDGLKGLATAACTVFGSVVDCENQTLGESVPIEGTGHSLHYQSDRSLGYVEDRRLDVPLLAEPPPESLKRIEVVLVVAGQRIERSFDPDPDAHFTYTWDGLDRFGRRRQGAHHYRLAVTYIYDGVYGGPPEPYGLTFAQPGTIRLEGSRTREEVGATRIFDGTFHLLDAKALGLGGFTLDVHHTYDPTSGTLFFGDGRRRSPRDIGWAADSFAGGGRRHGRRDPCRGRGARCDRRRRRAGRLGLPLGRPAPPHRPAGPGRSAPFGRRHGDRRILRRRGTRGLGRAELPDRSRRRARREPLLRVRPRR